MATASLSPAATREVNEPRGMVRAVPIVLASLGFGLLAQLLFFDTGLGVNLPIAIAALLGAGWAVRDRSRPLPRLADRWLAAAALILAAFVALRGDTTLVALDVLGVVGLTGAALASFGGLRVVERPLGGLLLLGGKVLASALGGGAAPVDDARRALPGGLLRDGVGRGMPVLRGLLIAIPLLILFAALFAAADAAFAEIAGDLFGWRLDLGSLPGRVVLALVAAWVAAGLLAFVVHGREPASAGQVDAAWQRRPRLGTGEALTVLVAIDLLFAGFVILQATYLFGGGDTRAATGLTYAEYARRGFFELLAVAFVVGGLVLALEGFVIRRPRPYLAATIGLVVLTLVVLASAFLRLRLYQDAYGWTELRFYVLAAIAWLAIGAVGAVVAVVTDRTRWLLHGMLALSIV
ncbi:MAG TPA: DUF4173 domain-containing protein, partial [Candidatus Dormibacteraeota bacterium]|nr:DUF4173 domain-containing protein [Candidatus Dormibacteraeota bacterium]